jgi:hypothetical protein
MTSTTTASSTTLVSLGLAEYLVAVLEGSQATNEANAAFQAATTLAQLVSANREVAAAQDRYAAVLLGLVPPPEAADLHADLLELTPRWAEWFRDQADAVETGDEARKNALAQEMLALVQQAIELGEKQQILVSTALAEHEERPLNRYLLQVQVTLAPFTQEYQTLLEELQWAMSVGDIDGLVAALEGAIDLMAGFSEQWNTLSPPPEASTYHELRAEFAAEGIEILEEMLAAVAADDMAAFEATLLRFLEFADRGVELAAMDTDLLIQGLSGT